MPFDAPFMLGPFAVDALGRLAPSDPTALPAFLFRWRGRVVRARFAQASPDRGHLLIRLTAGRVPSTASPHDPELRGRSFAVLRQLPHALPKDWRVFLLPDHGVRVEAESELALPITASDLLVELACFLLRLGPYLDVLEEEGIAGAALADGSMNT